MIIVYSAESTATTMSNNLQTYLRHFVTMSNAPTMDNKNNWAVSFIPFKMACRKPQVPRGLPQSFRDHSRSFRECFL